MMIVSNIIQIIITSFVWEKEQGKYEIPPEKQLGKLFFIIEVQIMAIHEPEFRPQRGMISL